MEYRIKDKDLTETFRKMDDLERLLSERIVDMHEIKGMVQGRHVYIYYRSLLWDAKHLLKDSVSVLELKEKK